MCKHACNEELAHFLKLNETNHVTMYDGLMSANQVRSLAFCGKFGPLEILVNGWKTWEAGTYLSLKKTARMLSKCC